MNLNKSIVFCTNLHVTLLTDITRPFNIEQLQTGKKLYILRIIHTHTHLLCTCIHTVCRLLRTKIFLCKEKEIGQVKNQRGTVNVTRQYMIYAVDVVSLTNKHVVEWVVTAGGGGGMHSK
jgi:hypothetical protein